MLRRAMILVGLIAAALLTATQANAERRVALVVGNSDYPRAAALRSPRNDASDLVAVLKSLGFEVLSGLDLDKQQFSARIGEFGQRLDKADVGLFFYAGHGMQFDGKNYLLPINAKLDDVSLISDETIELGSIMRLMESKAPVNLLFLDAGRKNSIAENLKHAPVSAQHTVALNRGLARIAPTGHDTLVAFATAPDQEVSENGGDRNSPFAAALLRHMPQPDLEVSVMLKQVTAEVRRDTHDAQRPEQLSDMSRTFYFAEAKAKPEPAAIAAIDASPSANGGANDRELDLTYWNSVQAQGDCDAVRVYLRRFPQGNFADLAKLMERRKCVSEGKSPLPEPAQTSGGSAPESSALSVTAAVQPPQAGVESPATAPPPVMPDVAPHTATSVGKSASLTAKEPGLSATDSSTSSPDARHDAETAPGASEAATTGPDFARSIQLELVRVGCGDIKPDGRWRAATRSAVRRFNKGAGTAFDVKQPTSALMAALHEHGQRVCPLECERGFHLRGETCEAIQTASSGNERVHTRARRMSNQRPVMPWGGFDDRWHGAGINRPCRYYGFC